MAMEFLGSFFSGLGGGTKTLTGVTSPSQGGEGQRQTRRYQKNAHKTLREWAVTGEGPSTAQALVDRNRAENAAQQVGMAKTMGGDPALANRMAAEGIGRGASEATYQGGLIRSQEQQQAMQNYLNNLATMRQQDLAAYDIMQQGYRGNAERKAAFTGRLIGAVAGGGGQMM